MAFIEINRHPSNKDLRWFAGLLIPFCGVIAGMLWRKDWSPSVCYSIAGAGSAIGLLGLLAPQSIRRVYVGWMLAVTPISIVVTSVLMGLVFFGVVWPIALLIRARQRDTLKLHWDKSAATYWEPRTQQTDPRRYFRQY